MTRVALLVALTCLCLCVVLFFAVIVFATFFFSAQLKMRRILQASLPEQYKRFYSWIFPLGGGLDFFRFVWRHEEDTLPLARAKMILRRSIVAMVAGSALIVVLFSIAAVLVYRFGA